ncbi:unnamed protein product [Oncorhynchus mykiss]|uniref:Ig-like domain-containing protein n=1 Tax=Oncorhynchus mykiss TaxID=8022 RepID=A0A060Y462_ONCMY|nr:unnamed protein product [Oncorhynchus mykiss]
MTGTLCLLLLSLCLTCCNGQSLESIPSSPVQKNPGETLSLSCKISGFTFDSHNTHWIRQPAGKSLEWLGFSGLGLGYHAKRFEGRMETTKDTSNSMLTLMLSGLRTEDSAVYYCARDTVSDITALRRPSPSVTTTTPSLCFYFYRILDPSHNESSGMCVPPGSYLSCSGAVTHLLRVSGEETYYSLGFLFESHSDITSYKNPLLLYEHINTEQVKLTPPRTNINLNEMSP